MPRLTTYNIPARYPLPDRQKDVLALSKKCSILALQECTDLDGPRLTPFGWEYHRPPQERSSILIWNPERWKCLSRRTFRVHSPIALEPRYIVSAVLRDKNTGRVYQVGSVHLAAFKTSSKKREQEFRYQEERAAMWLARKRNRVLAGDFNASPNHYWTPNLLRVSKFETPILETKGKTRIDHVVRKIPYNPAQALYTTDGVSDHRALTVRFF